MADVRGYRVVAEGGGWRGGRQMTRDGDTVVCPT